MEWNRYYCNNRLDKGIIKYTIDREYSNMDRRVGHLYIKELLSELGKPEICKDCPY